MVKPRLWLKPVFGEKCSFDTSPLPNTGISALSSFPCFLTPTGVYGPSGGYDPGVGKTVPLEVLIGVPC